MKTNANPTFKLFALMLTMTALKAGAIFGQDGQHSINVEDLVTKVAVIGRLKVPLRQTISLDAEWRFPEPAPAKPDIRIKLYVTQIAEVRLMKPVVFDVFRIVDSKGHLIEPVVGRKLKLNGYEDWVVKNQHPPEYSKLLGTMAAGNERREITQIHAVVRTK